jgi:enamine deaminase RidA (YjgF/YER057c/UK114 family)
MGDERKLISTGNPWERQVGFSRAVRAGNLVFTAGTIAADEDGVIHGQTCYEQCCYIFDKLGRVLREAGSDIAHTVKVVCYLTDLYDFEEFARAHAEYFSAIRPATTCVEISDLVSEDALVELEIVAVIPQ